MPDTPNRVVIERVQWLEVLPILRLASALRHALQPGKLVVALLAVLALHGCGLLMDATTGAKLLDQSDGMGVYEAFVAMQAVQLDALSDAALRLDHGLGSSAGVFDSLEVILFDTPRFLITHHPWYSLLFGAVALFVITLSGGIICRMSATQVCTGKLTSLPRATRFVCKRWAWYLLTPLIPAGFALLLGCVLMLAGLVFFNLPVLDVVGALLYGLLLLVGFIIAFIGFAFVFAMLLMTPAMSVEGTDSFDAIARAFNYVIYKPWQFAGYLFGSVVYLSVVYMIVWIITFWAVFATHQALDVSTFADSEIIGQTHYEVISGRFEVHDEPGTTAEVSGWLVARWIDLFYGIGLALMFSVVCSLQTQVYVLMRRAADGAPLDECAADDEAEPWSSPEDMVDPAAQAIAASGPKGHPKPDEAEADSSADKDEPNDKPGDAPKQD